MDASWTQDLLSWVKLNPGWTGVLVFVVACVESLVLIGILIPGIVLLFAVGAAIGLGVIDIAPIWIWGSAGALAGDALSFAVGRRYREQLVNVWPFSRYPSMLDRGQAFFRKHGNKSVLVGRFIGPLRPIIPATAGMLGLSRARFYSVAVPACIIWTPAYLLPGLLFGASLEVASEYAGRLTLVLIIIAVALWLTWWLIWAAYEVMVRQSGQWLRRVLLWTARHRIMGRLAAPVLDPSKPEAFSVGMLGLLLVAVIWSTTVLIFFSPFSSQPQAIDQAVIAQALALRNHLADPFMVAISQVSRWWVLLPAPAAVLLWLLGARHLNAALHWLAAIVGGVVLQLVLGWTLRAMPQMHSAGVDELYIPSAALTLSAVVLGFFPVLVARELKRPLRKWPYMVTALILTLLLLARVYLGMDWLSGALVGLFLGLCWTAIVGIAYRQRAKRKFSGLVVSLIFFGTLATTLAWQVSTRLTEDLNAFRPELPSARMDSQRWWHQAWHDVPRERTRFQSVPSRLFNTQMAVDLDALERALLEQGWETVEPASWMWSMKAINPEPDANSLPLLSKDYLGHPEALKLRLRNDSEDQQWALRIWDSGIRLAPGEQPLYLAQWSQESIRQRLAFFSYWRAEPVDEAWLAQRQAMLPGFATRMADADMLLIRPQRLIENAATPATSGADATADPPVPADPGVPDS